ncbi:MAG TPA: hypothetical protein VGP82_01390 [Ktedonobacterales bacterium]|jgi:hypothetical protein|nr:hypothetical protein [Ktedonobacterales bacterium]
MSPILLVLVLVAVIPHLLLAGAGVVRLFVQLPARHRLGAVAFAKYSRAMDLGNGLYLYPLLGIGGPLATWVAFALAALWHASGGLLLPLGIASGLAVLHSFTTTQAAPTMMRIGRAEDRSEILGPLLERFTLWSWARAILQAVTAGVLVWALLAS